MWASATLGDQLVTDATRKGQVGDAVTVDMAELAPAEPELEAAEPVWRGFYARPRLYGRCYVFTCVHGYAH
jgi:hypothetical protein